MVDDNLQYKHIQTEYVGIKFRLQLKQKEAKRLRNLIYIPQLNLYFSFNFFTCSIPNSIWSKLWLFQ